jgi:hypothetical protein
MGVMEHFLLLVPGLASQDAFSWGILFLLLIQCNHPTCASVQLNDYILPVLESDLVMALDSRIYDRQARDFLKRERRKL